MRLLSLFFVFVPALAFAQEATVSVHDAWAPPSLSQPNGVGFLTLKASQDDALTGVASDCCAAVETHNMTMENDVMRMRRVDEIALPAQHDVELKSGGYHLMLIGLKKPLEAGGNVPLTLTFKHAKPMQVVLDVKQRESATDRAHEHMGHH